MKRKALFARVAEWAVAHDRPLHDDLTSIAARVDKRGRPSAPEQKAISLARDGQMLPALQTAGVDPVVCQAAHLDTASVVEASRAVRQVPGNAPFAVPLLVPVLYATGVALLQFLVAVLVAWKVAPTLAEMGSGSTLTRQLQSLSILLPVGVAVAVAVLLWRIGRRFGRRYFARWALWSTRGTRILRAAAVLVRRGSDPSRTLMSLAGHGGLTRAGIEGIERADSLDADSVQALADHMQAGIETHARRTMVGLKIGVTLALLISASTVLLSVYIQLPRLALPIGGAP